MNTSSQTPSLARTRDALDLVRSLAIHNPELPAPYITLHTSDQVLLGLQVPFGAFDAWREALSIDADDVALMPLGTETHLNVNAVVSEQLSGRRVEVSVWLYGVGLPALPDPEADPAQNRAHGIPVVTLAEAVSLMGALPMPVGTAPALGAMFERLGPPAGLVMAPPTPGELAEQRHLVDPLDHVLEHLANERTS